MRKVITVPTHRISQWCVEEEEEAQEKSVCYICLATSDTEEGKERILKVILSLQD